MGLIYLYIINYYKNFRVRVLSLGSVILDACSTRPCKARILRDYINPLTPNDHYSGRTASLNSKRCILYIYSANIGTEYFKHGIYSPCCYLQNAAFFIILTYLVPLLFTFYTQCVLKLKKIIPTPKGNK
jgi:hypothetical protein